ncbi:hypothetical protein KSX_33420 [Ktedonospora formicarum]|uniref:Uncharacterized protein n=2 Tax=Ktedonospora formicarum TaxID=2778364 RepID=A0A8J3HWQ7_9CHLR|nr:hypothetical protein KSX_33420 [Ktedonospora formicarum]
MISRNGNSDKSTRSKTRSESQALISQLAVPAIEEARKKDLALKDAVYRCLPQDFKAILMLLVLIGGFTLAVLLKSPDAFVLIAGIIAAYCGVDGVKAIANHLPRKTKSKAD